MSESCNSRHLYCGKSWLMKSCFPNPHHHHHPLHCIATKSPHASDHSPAAISISFLPDDLLLECLSRVSRSSLPSLSLVCRRWAHLLDSPAFFDLRCRRGILRSTLFAVAFTESDSGFLRAANTHRIDPDSSWKIASFSISKGISQCLFPHARLSAIERNIYIIGRTAMARCDTWTGTVTARSEMIYPRKKFAAAVVGGKIYVAGGAARTSAVEEYDPSNDKWRVVSDAPRRRYGCIGASADGIFYVIGGLKIGTSTTGEHVSRAAGGAEARHVYASSMDLFDVDSGTWLRSRVVPGGGCVVAACASGGHVHVLTSHAVELSFWKFDARRHSSGGNFGEWGRLKSPPLPVRMRLDGTVRFSCVGFANKVVVIQVMGCINDLLGRRWRRSGGGAKEALVLVYDCTTGEWTKGPDLPEVIQRAACICVER